MFCGKCGHKMAETDARCSRCGWRNPRFANDKNTADNLDYDEPSQQQFQQAEYFPPAVPNFYNQPQDYYSDDELIPAAYRGADVPKQRKKRSRALMVTIIICAAAVLAAAGVLVGFLVYHQSEGYKLQQAETKILDGNYRSGIEQLDNLNSRQADDTRRLAEFLELKTRQFDVAYNEGMLQTAGEDAGVYAAALGERFEALGDLQLPEKLQSAYRTMQTRYEGMKNCLGKLSQADLYDAQHSVLAYKSRKEGAGFTVEDLSGVVKTAEPAVKNLETQVINSEAFQALTADCGAQAVKTMNEFYQITSAQVNQDAFDLENYKRSQRSDAALKLSDTVSFYDAAVGTGLKSLTSNADAEANAKALCEALKIAWTDFSFTVKS